MKINDDLENLCNLPNIGKVLAKKLISVGITNENELKDIGSENAIIKIASLENHGACINMLYALEGAVKGIRWHNLSKQKKQELSEFFRIMKKDI